MADQKQSGPDDDDDVARHAADEPTAVWSSEMLREAGLDDLNSLPEAAPLPPATPALKSADPSVVVDPRNAGLGPQAASPAPSPVARATGGELSWATTIGLAAGLGGLVYLLIRFLR